MPRRVPSLLEHLDDLSLTIADGSFVCLDYDGTLTPIVNDPAAAHLGAEMRSTLARLAQRLQVAIISGRDRADVEARVSLPGLIYAGSHGFDIAGLNHTMTLPAADVARPSLEEAAAQLARQLNGIDGIVLERKRFGVSTHYRNVDPSEVETVRQIVDGVLAGFSGLRVQPGKMVLDLQPDLDWDKGRAVQWILDALDLDAAQARVIYVGDDETDEDAFQALGSNSLGVRVGPARLVTHADYRVDGPDDVKRFLGWLAQLHP